MSREDCAINAGVFVMDVAGYKRLRMQERIASLVHQQLKLSMWKGGVQQSSFILALFNHTTLVDHRWNTVQLGYKTEIANSTLDNGYVLHWNGVRKPWLDIGLYIDRWLKYYLPT